MNSIYSTYSFGRYVNRDLNLLTIFDALMREKNVSRAAKTLHLSQPAMSHALARLREALGDELFVRAARGVVPTPRALALTPAITEALARIREVFAAPESFDPAKVKAKLCMASTEFFEHLVLPWLIPELGRMAPHIVLQSKSTSGHLPKRGDGKR